MDDPYVSNPQTARFGELLRRYRLARGLTQAELAGRAGLSVHGVQKLERGVTRPNRDTAARLEGVLELAPAERDQLRGAVRPVRRHGTVGTGPPEPVSSAPGLPVARTSFVGREQVLRDVRGRLDGTAERGRLLTLTGPGGTGKTRVALEAADGVRERYPDGVRFIGLAPVSDPRLVVPTIAQALGVADDARLSPLQMLTRYLADRHLLLILDNFEQVLGAAVEVGDLLAGCPRLQVLVTSRAPLRLSGEQELAVPPLPMDEAVALFVERARAVRADFGASDAEMMALVEICGHLDGLPLAIELAAARSRLLDPPAMLRRIEHRLQLLTGGARDAPSRQQTLRDTIAWSYDLLEPAEQALFRCLAVFVGGCTIEAAQQVFRSSSVAAGTAPEVLDLADQLVAQSLVQAEYGLEGDVRLHLLETIREYGLEQLAWCGELESARRRHATCYLAFAVEAESGLGGPNARRWLDRLEREHDNLRAALEWSLTDARDQGQTALCLGGPLARFWWIAGYFGEGQRWLTAALAAAPAPTAARMKGLHGAGWLAHVQRQSATARRWLQESLTIAEQLDDGWWRAWILHALGRVAYFEFEPDLARAYGEASLAIAEALGDRWLIAWALHLLGLTAYIAGDHAAAAAYYERCLSIRYELGHLEGLVIVLHLNGMLPHRAGDLPTALRRYRAALDVARELNSAWFYRCVLPLFAAVAAEHQPTRAARLGAAVTLLSESAHTLPIPVTEALFEAGLATARQRLGGAAFEAAWAAGRSLSLEMTIAEALAVEVGPRDVYPAQLTRTEVEVLRRLARGHSTREVAEDLVVAVSTVDRHITHIYAKIGRHGRAAATAFALEHGLT